MKNNDFEYKYTAPTSEERKEIESIRSFYLQKEGGKSKLEYLRELDFKVKNIPTILSIFVGILGILVFGLGLSILLEWNKLLWGIVISLIGLVVMLSAYIIYIKTGKYLKSKYGNKIIKLSDELLNEDVNGE